MKQVMLVIALLAVVCLLNAGISLVEKQGSSLIIEFDLGEYRFSEESGFTSIHTDQVAGASMQSGAPSLPHFEMKIGVPPNGSAEFQILSTSSEQIRLDHRVMPVPFINGTEGVSQYDFRIDEALYNPTRQDPIEKLGVQFFRDHPYVPFIINPFVYDGNLGMEVLTKMRIQISISGDMSAKSPPREDPMAKALLSQLLNADDAKFWIQQTRHEIKHAEFYRSPWWIKIETDKSGIFRINPSHLSSLPISEIDPRSFRIFSTFGKVLPNEAVYSGEDFAEIPIYVHGEDDAVFDSQDYIAFYGTDRSGYEINSALQTDSQKIYHNPYSANGVYWLTFAGSFDDPPMRIPTESPLADFNHEVTSHPEIIHIEEERHRRDLTGYTWYMSRLFGSSTLDYAFDINLPDLDSAEEQLLQMRLREEDTGGGNTHRISVFVNGEIVPNQFNSDYHQWSSTSIFNFSRPSSAFQSGNNRIVIRVLRGSSSSNLFLDYITVRYNRNLQKGNSQYLANAHIPTIGQGVKYNFTGNAENTFVFKISSLGSISRLQIETETDGFSFTSTGGASTRFAIAKPGEFYSPVSVRQMNPVDLTVLPEPIHSVIITPGDFLDKAQELADIYWQNWQYPTKVVLDTDIFAQFSGGHPDPGAIRQYLRYLYHNAPEPKIQAATLLGLGTIDWRNFSGVAAAKNKMMIYQNPSNSITSDDYIAMLTNDRHPEIAIGRYPVTNLTELNTMISNFREYTQNPTPGLWRNNLLFLADDTVNGPYTGEWIHSIDMQSLASMINPAVQNTKIFAEEYDYDEFLNKPAVRNDFFDNINDGRLLWYYIGHGSFDKLGMQNYFSASTDMIRFQNQGQMGLFITASCEVSWFDYWTFDSLSQRTVLMNGMGAIASVGATRKSFPGPNHSLMRLFVPNMINDRHPLGYSLTNAKTRFTSNPDNNAMYVILGDPNLEIVPPQRNSNMVLSVFNNAETTLRSDSKDDGIPTLHARQQAHLQGKYDQNGLRGEATFVAFDNMLPYQISHLNVNKRGPQLFRGKVSVEDSELQAGFIVPDNVSSGDTGLALAYFWDEQNKKDYIAYYSPISLSNEVLPGSPLNDSPPEISLYLSSMDFRPGDTVSTKPVLYATISDENGINVTGSSGHHIFLILNNALQPVSVTEYFQYDTDSFTSGSLTYPLPELSEGHHVLQLIAFDNYNLPQVAETHFIAKDTGPISLENLLPYPNPMSNTGHITFLISDNAEISLDIFTMSGRRIRRIETTAKQGFNQIPFDGRDDFGKKLANNTYFIRVRAKTQDGKSIEKRERLVIYK